MVPKHMMKCQFMVVSSSMLWIMFCIIRVRVHVRIRVYCFVFVLQIEYQLRALLLPIKLNN